MMADQSESEGKAKTMVPDVSVKKATAGVNILSLPNEVLMQVLVEAAYHDKSIIPQARLVNRLFNDLASSIAFRAVTVDKNWNLTQNFLNDLGRGGLVKWIRTLIITSTFLKSGGAFSSADDSQFDPETADKLYIVNGFLLEVTGQLRELNILADQMGNHGEALLKRFSGVFRAVQPNLLAALTLSVACPTSLSVLASETGQRIAFPTLRTLQLLVHLENTQESRAWSAAKLGEATRLLTACCVKLEVFTVAMDICWDEDSRSRGNTYLNEHRYRHRLMRPEIIAFHENFNPYKLTSFKLSLVVVLPNTSSIVGVLEVMSNLTELTLNQIGLQPSGTVHGSKTRPKMWHDVFDAIRAKMLKLQRFTFRALLNGGNPRNFNMDIATNEDQQMCAHGMGSANGRFHGELETRFAEEIQAIKRLESTNEQRV